MAPSFLIRYRFNGQAMSTVVRQERLSVEEARRFLLAVHNLLDEASITDVQVSRMPHDPKRDIPPGDSRQP